MLQIKNIHKQYKTGDLIQNALNSVCLNLRDSEFVAILGPSGSGKTTLLNIVGGLDRYDSGDLIINGISTKKYTDRDWDSYRNHTIGFVFQSYNLIPHQTILSNVELALTISGISGAERRRRAAEALQKVGLGNQLHKHPSEMSGGQMQRVAIARALVNNPDILLADEPTGALDSETSIQVMELLKEVAKDRLVVMVTHNPELAQQYATRIVNLKDGSIISDSMPYEPDESAIAPPVHKNMGRSSMSLLTALSLSFNNLRTKKARTLLTAFAGSIGIIGIALIISLSEGVNNYIADMERNTLSEYPIQILSSGLDLTSLMSSSSGSSLMGLSDASTAASTEGEVTVQQALTQMLSGIGTNDLQSLKAWLDSDACTVDEDSTAIEYAYPSSPLIYRVEDDGSILKINPDESLSSAGISSSSSNNSLMSSMMDTNVFHEIAETPALYIDQYDVKAGRWPEGYDECVLVLNADGSVTDYALYAMGLRDHAELENMVEQFAQNKNITLPDDFSTYSYDDFLGMSFKLIYSIDCYTYDEEYGIWRDKSDDADYMTELVKNGDDLTIVGIVQPKADASATVLLNGILYTHDLTYRIIDQAAESEIVKQQLANPDINVFTGEKFNSTEGFSFDPSTLFSVDTDQLAQAFRFDTSALDFDLSGAFDLSDAGSMDIDLSSLMDTGNFSLDMSSLTELQGLDEMDMSSLLEDMDVSISSDALHTLTQKILTGYKDYIIGNGILNLNKLSFESYMQTDAFKELLSSSMGDLLDTDALKEKFAAAIEEKMQTVMEGYSAQITTALQSQISASLEQALAQAAGQLSGQIGKQLQNALQSNISKLGDQMEGALKIDASAFQSAITVNLTESDITELVKSSLLSTGSSYENNLTTLGYADYAVPEGIYIYPKDFDSKARVVEKLDEYNTAMEQKGDDGKTVQYTDVVGTMMTAVTKIVNMISNMLIAFVSISLVVSSIMIGVITYISVLERRKEIGILRAIGASKRNVSDVFNAETFIIGLCSGIMGVGLSLLLLIPGNMLIHSISGSSDVTAALPPLAALVLIALAAVLTIIGGLIPARSAAKCNPVTALRSE